MPVNNGLYSIPIDIADLPEGWNYIVLSAKRPATRWTVGVECFINKIANQASVFVPALEVKNARIAGNVTNNTGYMLEDDYSATGCYSLSEGYDEESPPEYIKLDEDGIPTVQYSDGWFYNPVTIAQQALRVYGSYLQTQSAADKEKFLHFANWFISNQEENGSFPYDFSFAMRPTVILPRGFVSSMAQGQVLSVLARAFVVTDDEKYLACGARALDFMLQSGDTDIFQGGSRSLEDLCNSNSDMKEYRELRIYEEYVFDPSTYVLNGDLYALLGIADWSAVASENYGAAKAKASFEEGIKAIEVMLPYYDFYGWSSYDLLQYTADDLDPHFGSRYAHRCHIELLHVLADLSGSETLAKYAKKFAEYADDPFWAQIEVLARN
ncbi:D-glucuronyl C5-epimerase family protein [Adlercreutzia mucosicola]|uniref:D-glucuronyl C5-epimerase family protein n=1 Tax=Adlercreutzia mucosicola TaxID=580026 RepID=UPI0013664682